MRALITGAARGIGRAIALRLAQDAGPKARLLLTDFRADDLQAVAQAARALGAQVITEAADLTDPKAPAALAAHLSTLGGLDALISNAGVALRGPLLSLSVADWDTTHALHVRAPWLLARACHAALKECRGSIVITASVSAQHATTPGGAYSTSKAAARMLAQQLAVEWGPDGIRVNSVSPGMIVTPMTQQVYDDPASRAQREARVPLRRIGEPEDIANVVAFLVGPDAAYVHGADLVVDGGLVQTLMAGNPGWKSAH